MFIPKKNDRELSPGQLKINNTNMEKENQDRSVTFRVKKDLYQALTNKAIQQSLKEKRIVKVSEIIRLTLENLVK